MNSTHLIEALAVLGMVGLAALAIYLLNADGKDIALQVTSALGGYIGGRAIGAIQTKMRDESQQ